MTSPPAGASSHLLELRDLHVEFHTRDGVARVINGVSYHVNAGETLAVLGESGSGKSVTAQAIMGILDMPPASIRSGEILYQGVDLLAMPEAERRTVRGAEIAMVFQDALSALNPVFPVGWQIAETLRVREGRSRADAMARAVELMDLVKIPAARARLRDYPHQFSGGMRQRVMIAAALALNPKVLLADEPTTALDVTVQAQILDLLKSLQQRLGMAILFITHDLGIVRKLADRVCVMQRGKIVEQGPTEDVFTAPQHAYTRALLQAEPKPDPAPIAPEAPVVVETQDLKVWFPIRRGVLRKTVGHIKAVDGVSITVRKGETLGVVGESGSGKTTLGLAILRLIASEGPVIFMGNGIQKLKFKQMLPFRRDMQIVFQDPYGSLSPRMSVSDIIEEGLWVHHPHLSADEREARVVRALKDVGLDPETRFRYPHEFSGGQRQRIAVARAIVLEPTFIMLDEPTSALDMLIQSQIVDLLRDLQKQRELTYLFISHDLRVVSALASRLVVMRHGKVVEEGPAADVFAAPKSDYTRALFAAAFNIETAAAGVVSE
jgi:microcin C transport system ATP-binding protein